MNSQRQKLVNKVINTLKMGGRSEKTIKNYVSAINRFLEAFKYKQISIIKEEDIINYMKYKYLNKNCSAHTYNMNISAIKYFYSINYNKEFNNNLLPHAKFTKKLPTIIEKETFIKIFNEESNLKHKCWLLLGYCSGLRVEEVAKVTIQDINSKEHKLKVLGKRKKERYTVLPDITIKYLRLYYKSKYNYPTNNGMKFLFRGYNKNEHMSSLTITNYFTSLKRKYQLDESITFHSLRHSFATNFITNGGDPFILKSMMGHTSMSTTSIYIHMGRDFNNLKGVKYDEI